MQSAISVSALTKSFDEVLAVDNISFEVRSSLYPELTGFENLCFCGALYGMRKMTREAKAEELLERFSLTEAANRKFAGYSRGMKRKLIRMRS